MLLSKLKAIALVALVLAAPRAAAQDAPQIDTRFSSVTHYATTATPVAAEATDVTFGADTAGSLNSTYLKFYDALNAHCYYVWFNINAAGVDPAVASCTGIPVAGATGVTAATLAGAARTAVGAAAAATYITVSGATTHLILTNKTNGATTDLSDGLTTHATGFSISKTTDGVSGALAIPAISVAAGVNGWEICNAGVNTSTYLVVGKTAGDPTTDGTRLSKGACYTCLSCTASLLKAMYVSSQAASNDYAVVQFKQ